MLSRLYISNYAIIDEVSIEFSGGLNIITGETGAGKSILLGALELVTGSRADTSVLNDKESKCIVEAYINVTGNHLQGLFEEQDLDYADDLIIRREINAKGRSRAFVNDTPVNLKVLSNITEKLVNIHRQFGSQDIFERSFQTMVLDAMADQLALAREYQQGYYKLSEEIKKLAELEESILAGIREEEFLRFQLNEIDEFNPDPENDRDLPEQIRKIEHTEEIIGNLKKCAYLLSEDEQSIIQSLRQLNSDLSGIASYGKDYESLSMRMSSILTELEDLSNEASSLGSEGMNDPEEAEILKSRYDSLQKLLFKHQIADIEELIAVQEKMQEGLSDRHNQGEEKRILEERIASQRKLLEKQAVQLSEGRQQIKPTFEKEIKRLLADLAMKHTYFEARVESAEELNRYGKEVFNYYFSANPGIQPQLLKNVASGGEISRLTLCIQSLVAGKFSLPTMIFDEIDSGVSGDTAKRMGSMLSSLGKRHQLVVITHTPQVAASGEFHYFVEKMVHGNSTSTNIRKLDDKDRLTKIAIMLSSDPPTKAARNTAKELMKIK